MNRKKQEEEETFILKYVCSHRSAWPRFLHTIVHMIRKQELTNLLRQSRYIEALRLALSLNHPATAYSVLQTLSESLPLSTLLPFHSSASSTIDDEHAMSTDDANPFPEFLRSLPSEDVEKVLAHPICLFLTSFSCSLGLKIGMRTSLPRSSLSLSLQTFSVCFQWIL